MAEGQQGIAAAQYGKGQEAEKGNQQEGEEMERRAPQVLDIRKLDENEKCHANAVMRRKNQEKIRAERKPCRQRDAAAERQQEANAYP